MSELAKLYEKPSSSNKVFPMKRLFNLKMSKGGPLVDNLNEFNTISIWLSSVALNFDDEVRDLLFMCSFIECWNGLVMDISNFFSRYITLNFDDVVASICSEEM